MTARAKTAPAAAGSGSGSDSGVVPGAPRAPSIPRKQAVFRVPACLMIHREDLLHGLHLAGVADDWDVPNLYPAETIGNRKIALSREESEALDRMCEAFKVTQRVAVTAALHHVRRSRLAATFVADCRLGGCRAVSCRAEFNPAVEAKAIARSAAVRTACPPDGEVSVRIQVTAFGQVTYVNGESRNYSMVAATSICPPRRSE